MVWELHEKNNLEALFLLWFKILEQLELKLMLRVRKKWRSIYIEAIWKY